VRFLGTFLPDPTEAPKVVVDYLGSQRDIADPSVLKGYGEGETRWDHAAEIRRLYGYRDFADDPGHTALTQTACDGLFPRANPYTGSVLPRRQGPQDLPRV
jgi:hypothetical protein